MTSYGTSGTFDSHWQTPPPDSTTAFFDQTSSSYDTEFLDVFQPDPFQPYSGPRGQSTVGMENRRATYSDSASSPQGSLSYASSSTGYSTGNTSFGVGGPGSGIEFDLNSLFNGSSGAGSTSGDSPPFDFGNSLSCEFDTSGLQGLFSQQPPILQPQFQQPFQGLSPSSTMSGNSPPNAYPLAGNYHYQHHVSDAQQQPLPMYPTQYLAPAQGPSATYPTPARNPSIASAASPSSIASVSHLETESSSKRRRVTLAETAGLAPPQQHASSSIAPAAFTVKADVHPQLAASAPGQTQAVPARKPNAKSPVELIVNAGMSNAAVYHAPTYQLLPKPVNIAASNNAAKGKRGTSSILPASSVSDDKLGGGKRKKTAERGHNAVEQKYRNSINNALATLRDTIPALRHLKPLPSMPVSKRKASQFTLPSNVGTSVPSGLVDGVQAAKTLSKGVILNKAIEYIDYLRFSRESQNEDLETFKEMVRTMVGGGEQLVAEFEQKQQERDLERTREREMDREDGEGDDDDEGDGEGDEEEDVNPAPAVPKTKKAAPASKKRGAAKKETTSPPVKTKPMAPHDQESTMTLSSQQISPPLTSDYRHVQAHNAAHLESIAAGSQSGPVTHTFPPSPVSSDDHSVSPAALVVDPSQYHSFGAQPPRVLLASFMGLSFAGGVGYDWTSGAAAAASEASEVLGSAWTSRLARRSLVSASQGPLVDLLHPSLLSGLVTLGIASFFVSLVYIVQPLIRSGRATQQPDASRLKALAALAAADPAANTKPTTFATAKANALAARSELLALVRAPTSFSLLPALAKETSKWILASRLGLSWTTSKGLSYSQDEVEQAVAWVRIAEIETTVGADLSTLPRLYTFLRLLNLSRSHAWPEVTASTSLPAVTALLSAHLLSSGHVRWAEGLWDSISSLRKKGDSSELASDSFVEVALDVDFETVKTLLDPSLAFDRSEDDLESPKDTVPLLRVAEATCVDALQDVWTRTFTSIVDSTCPPHQVDAVPSKEKLQALIRDGDIVDTLELVFKASVEGSELRSLTLLTRAVLDTFTDASEDKPHVVARVCMSSLLSEARQGGPFARFGSAAPLCRLLLPSLPTDLVASFPPAEAAVNSVDHLAATTLSWLLLRRESLDLLSDRSAYPSPPPSPTSASPSFDKVDLKTHARALSLRRLLAHEAFETDAARTAVDDESLDFDDAKDLLVDALTCLARRAAGLRSRDEDSGVEL